MNACALLNERVSIFSEFERNLIENEKNLINSVESYQQLIKLNKIIEKKFQRNLKSINEETIKKVNAINKKNETQT